jgi:hypothetical protein
VRVIPVAAGKDRFSSGFLGKVEETRDASAAIPYTVLYGFGP